MTYDPLAALAAGAAGLVGSILMQRLMMLYKFTPQFLAFLVMLALFAVVMVTLWAAL